MCLLIICAFFDWAEFLKNLGQVQLKSVRAKFHADWTKSQRRVLKSRFSSFCDFVKTF